MRHRIPNAARKTPLLHGGEAPKAPPLPHLVARQRDPLVPALFSRVLPGGSGLSHGPGPQDIR